MMTTIRHIRVVLLIGVLLSLFTGCGENNAVDGTVSGKITYKGTPTPEGCLVFFVPEMGALPATGVVGAGGSFTLQIKGGPDIPAGKYKIAIGTPVVEETAEEAMLRVQDNVKQKEYPEIPETYRDSETSGETFEVKEGANTYELDMQD